MHNSSTITLDEATQDQLINELSSRVDYCVVVLGAENIPADDADNGHVHVVWKGPLRMAFDLFRAGAMTVYKVADQSGISLAHDDDDEDYNTEEDDE